MLELEHIFKILYATEKRQERRVSGRSDDQPRSSMFENTVRKRVARLEIA